MEPWCVSSGRLCKLGWERATGVIEGKRGDDQGALLLKALGEEAVDFTRLPSNSVLYPSR